MISSTPWARRGASDWRSACSILKMRSCLRIPATLGTPSSSALRCSSRIDWRLSPATSIGGSTTSGGTGLSLEDISCGGENSENNLEWERAGGLVELMADRGVRPQSAGRADRSGQEALRRVDLRVCFADGAHKCTVSL